MLVKLVRTFCPVLSTLIVCTYAIQILLAQSLLAATAAVQNRVTAEPHAGVNKPSDIELLVSRRR